MTLESFKAGVANDLRNALVQVAPVDKGRLKASIKVEVVGGKIVITMVDYAIYVEYGTEPHIIRPKTKKALKFKVNTVDVFAKQVRHPGTDPNPFIRNTFYHKLPRIIEENAKKHLPGVSIKLRFK